MAIHLGGPQTSKQKTLPSQTFVPNPSSRPPLPNLNKILEAKNNKSPFTVEAKPPVDNVTFKAPAKPAERPVQEPQVFGARGALKQFEKNYQDLLANIDLKRINPEKIQDAIARAEKFRNMPYSEAERVQFVLMAKSGDADILKLLALELRIGIPKKYETRVYGTLGELMLLHRDDTQAIKEFLDRPDLDPNIKAHIATIYYAGKVEGTISRIRNFNRRIKKRLPGISGLLPAIFSDN